MPESDDERLRRLLGGEPPAGVSQLGHDARADLVEVLTDARCRQAKSLEAAFTASLKHVPFPVRGIVRKVLMG